MFVHSWRAFLLLAFASWVQAVVVATPSGSTGAFATPSISVLAQWVKQLKAPFLSSNAPIYKRIANPRDGADPAQTTSSSGPISTSTRTLAASGTTVTHSAVTLSSSPSVSIRGAVTAISSSSILVSPSQATGPSQIKPVLPTVLFPNSTVPTSSHQPGSIAASVTVSASALSIPTRIESSSAGPPYLTSIHPPENATSASLKHTSSFINPTTLSLSMTSIRESLQFVTAILSTSVTTTALPASKTSVSRQEILSISIRVVVSAGVTAAASLSASIDVSMSRSETVKSSGKVSSGAITSPSLVLPTIATMISLKSSSRSSSDKHSSGSATRSDAPVQPIESQRTNSFSSDKGHTRPTFVLPVALSTGTKLQALVTSISLPVKESANSERHSESSSMRRTTHSIATAEQHSTSRNGGKSAQAESSRSSTHLSSATKTSSHGSSRPQHTLSKTTTTLIRQGYGSPKSSTSSVKGGTHIASTGHASHTTASLRLTSPTLRRITSLVPHTRSSSVSIRAHATSSRSSIVTTHSTHSSTSRPSSHSSSQYSRSSLILPVSIAASAHVEASAHVSLHARAVMKSKTTIAKPATILPLGSTYRPPKSTTTTAKSTAATSSPPLGKRGLSYNLASLTLPFGARNSTYTSQVSWMYNWYSSPCTTTPSGGTDCSFNPRLQYIPTLFSNASSLTSVWSSNVERALSNYGTKSLFSFNEPDACFYGGACMDMDYAVAAYRAHVQPFAGRALLGAPAVTNAGAPSGIDWLRRFMAKCSDCRFDFVNVHWYSNKYAGVAYLESFIKDVRVVAAGRPIWITEFALDGEYDPTDAEVQLFMRQSADFLDQQADVAGYAWFMDADGILSQSGKMSALGNVWDGYWNGTTRGGIAH